VNAPAQAVTTETEGRTALRTSVDAWPEGEETFQEREPLATISTVHAHELYVSITSQQWAQAEDESILGTFHVVHLSDFDIVKLHSIWTTANATFPVILD